MSQEKNWVQQPKGEGGGGDHNPVWEPKANDTIEGTLIGSQANVSKYNKTVYEVRIDDGTAYSILGTVLLEKQMADIPINSYIKIEYLGKVQGKGNAYHDYNVFVAGEQAPAPAPAVATDAQTAAPVAAAEPVAAAPAATPAPAAAPEAQPPAAATEQPAPTEGGENPDVPF